MRGNEKPSREWKGNDEQEGKLLCSTKNLREPALSPDLGLSICLHHGEEASLSDVMYSLAVVEA